MPTVRKIEAVTKNKPKQRIGVYVRVSTDSSDQQNSYASQIGYYTKIIEKHSDWELVDVYADEGITGTKLDRRDEFNRMMRDARKGKLDEILVKSVSRFARNTKDCLINLRELNLLGVKVKFDRENLSTETLTSELMVSVSGSLAQEESISLSQNMRWSYQKRMQSGKFIACRAPFGYRISGREMNIHPEEAEIVKWVFESYLSGMNVLEIANALTDAEISTREGNYCWQRTTIAYMLQNEKYIGDSIGQKSLVTDFPFKHIRNKGQKPKYYAEATHPAIIDKDTFYLVQELIISRRPKTVDAPATYPLTLKIRCANCGSTFTRRTTTNGSIVWACRKHDNNAKLCPVGRIPEKEIYKAFNTMALKLKYNLTTVLAPAIAKLQEMREAEARNNGDMLEVTRDIATLHEQSLILSRLRERNLIPTDSFLEKNASIHARLAELKKKRRILLEANDAGHTNIQKITELLHIIKDAEITDEFDEQLFADIVEEIRAYSQERICFRLIGGLELEAEIRGKLR